MIILGLDPGTATVGFALLEKEDRILRVIEYGVIETKAGLSLSERLVQIGNDLKEVINTYHPTICGIEKLFFLRNVTNGIDVAHARGVMLHTLATSGIPIVEFTPLQVKQGIAGNGFAKKPQVQKALQMVLKLSEIPKPDDAADALAIAYLTSLKVRV
ncbi:MAG: crossover junction endodeoxyribonuclease RuvC [Candidatus Gracilibacteria bacterium]|nr:crossover junction endodeoxyribonuclease RuvC [Candidatus Gracilibacteria bacterium]